MTNRGARGSDEIIKLVNEEVARAMRAGSRGVWHGNYRPHPFAPSANNPLICRECDLVRNSPLHD